jgi:hypothetical protein
MMDDRLRICNSRGEADLDDETAHGTGSDAQRGIVRGGDRPDDREPETDAVAVAVCTAVAVPPLERHQKSLDLFRRDERAGVGDPEHRAPRPGPGGGVDPSLDVHAALPDVVTHRVVEEVLDQALEQAPIAFNRNRATVCQRGVELRPPSAARISGEHVVDHRRQIDRLAAIETLLAPGKGEQRLDQPLLLLAGGQQPPIVGLQRLDRGVRIGERDLNQRALPRQRSTQLVRGVGHELALGDERSLEAGDELVERVAELLELVVGAVECQPRVQVRRGDRTSRSRDRPQSAKRAAGEQPP